MPEAVHCGNFESLAVLHALGELAAPVCAAIEEHAHACPECAAVLQRETALAAILRPNRSAAGELEPSDLLVARCRTRLDQSLDEAAQRPSGWRDWLRARNWAEPFRVSMHVHPGWSVAALLFVAVVAGLAGWEGLGRVPLQQFSPAVITVSAASPPPVAPAVSDAAPQAAALEQPAVDAVAESTQVYPATDAVMSDATAQSLFEAVPAPEQTPLQLQARRGPARGQDVPRLGRHEPPLRMPAGRSSRGSASAWRQQNEGRLAGLSRRMETLWWGGLRVDSAEQQERLVSGSLPEYPEVARRAGIEGLVTMLLRIGTDGSVEDAQLLSGEPVLGRAAAEAVEQWRYQPARVGGQPVNVLTSVTLAFELR
jgi:TonB family protein